MISLLRQILLACLFVVFSADAFAQQVILQGGSTTNGHAPMYITQGTQPYVMDSGTAGGGAANIGLSELLIAKRGVTIPPFANGGSGPLSTNFCNYDGPTTATAGYHYLCFDPNAQGGGLIAYGYNGTTGPLSLSFNVNGSIPLILSSSGVTLTTPTITGGTITGSVFTSGAITNSAITATNANLTTPTITGGTISGASITATGAVLTTPAITGGTISGSAISNGTITNAAISGGTISGVTITGLTQSVRVVTAAGVVTVTTADNLVVVNKTVGAATTVNLPGSPPTGMQIIIKDGKGDAQNNNITITPAAGNIDGSASLLLRSNYASVNLIYNGTQWNAL